MDEKKLNQLIEKLTSDKRLDWAQLERDQAEFGRVGSLQKLGRVARAFSSLHHVAQAQPDVVPERFGRLELRGRLGGGRDGIVFRAFDPALEREVALKLRRSAAVHGVGGAERLMREARALARIRHPHVIAVHGADEHDGRVGIWTDLLEGETLEQRLERGGRFGVDEARAVGVALCQALAAIHGAGLTHGDIKTSNVMRETGGRIVLLDFGSARPAWLTELATGGVSGSPLYMAPEILEGAEPTPRSDLYALGVTLYRLVTGAYPVEAVSMLELRAHHSRGERVPLRDRRPDLPGDFVDAIESVLHPDPARRPPSAGAFERRLNVPVTRRSLVRGGLAAAVALGLAFALARWLTPAPLAVAIELHREGSVAALADGARIAAGDELYLSLDLHQPVHLYVLNEDSHGVITTLFPRESLEPRNPLPAGRDVRVPGPSADQVMNWAVGAGTGVERLLLVAARKPLPLIAQRLAEWEAADRASAPRLRAIDGVRARPAAHGASRLAALAHELGQGDDPERLWLRELTLENPPR
jgi:serine/threonine protein kinase